MNKIISATLLKIESDFYKLWTSENGKFIS